MRLILILSFLLFSIVLSGQGKPAFMPEDFDTDEVEAHYCQPGIDCKSRSRGLELSYQWMFGGNLKEEEGVILPPVSKLNSLENLVFKLYAPIINKETFKMLIGYSYRPEIYNFQVIGPSFGEVFERLDNQWLKSNHISLTMSKPINHKFYAVFRANISANGDYGGFMNFNERYLAYNFAGIWGIKEHDEFEWGIGLTYSKNFRGRFILPIIIYNRHFSGTWGIEALLPVFVHGRLNVKDGLILLFGPEYHSRSYSIDVENSTSGDSQIFEENHSEIRFMVSMEKRLRPWVWLNVKGGYQYNFSTDFIAEGNEPASFKVEPKHSPFFKVGIFISPPDHFK